MGILQSRAIPPGTYSSNATGEVVTPYSIRRHPNYASGVLQLPQSMKTAQDMYLQSMEKFKERDYIGIRKIDHDTGKRENRFSFISYTEAFRISNNFACGMMKLGVRSRDLVGIFSENRPEWVLSSDASYLLGFTMVHIYETFSQEALEFSLKNSNVEYLLVSAKNLKKVKELNDDILKQFKFIILFDEIKLDEKVFIDKINGYGGKVMTFNEVCEIDRSIFTPVHIEPEQIMYICYSSGTTGFPKGVMISHRAFITNLIAVHDEYCDETFERHISYLPMCHVFEKMCSCAVLFSGGKIGVYSGSIATLSDDMKILKPTCLCTVPRVLQRMNDAIQTKINSSSFIVKSIFFCAFHLKNFLMMNNLSTKIPDIIVFDKIKGMTGGCITNICNGSAAIAPNVHKNMQIILGIPIRSGYGLSEGGSGNTLGPRDIRYTKFGTNGYPLSNVEIRISKVEGFDEPGEGEILMGGTGLCSGYLNDPEGTKNLFTDETHTWIHTGDIGKFDEDNSLLVVDRMRSIFKLTQGEYVAADLLSTYFEESKYIENIFLYGDSSKEYLVGIVLPNKENIEVEIGKKFDDDSFKEAIKSNEINDLILQSIRNIAKEKKLHGYQIPRKIKCVIDAWTIDNGCISPTLKIKRRTLYTRYKLDIENLYGERF